MPKRILIDATHVEETRVALLENGRVQNYDSETWVKKQLKGNIYLAKVTRVEASLQAAFVDYGGERHGFLPFSEIHPDYYNIPTADKQELLRSIRNQERAEESKEYDGIESDVMQGEEEVIAGKNDEPVEASLTTSNEGYRDSEDDVASKLSVEEIGGEEEADTAIKNPGVYKQYKIQEVIKRNQIILVQVDKEERGNKGASLTSFISLAGRFCVLMPNSLRKGGVSRKIGSIDDRRRLKKVISELRISEDAGIIVRTAGSGKSDKEIRDDYDYLASLWNQIREATLTSTAPAFIHEESSIIKRTMRDMYSDEVKEVLIDGEETYKAVKNFIQKVMPGHKGDIKHYKNKVPIFTRYKVEEQIAALFKAQVNLESGGSIVINPTEALISIDVNSGKSTGQRNVEETATNTNLEAAKEISRQLRLRDLSGLIVIDFIDMMEVRNRKAVENVLKNEFMDDRAKVQIGRISTFGLLEMSRQRMRASFLEVNTKVCHECNGSGNIKSTEMLAISLLRAIEDDVSRGAKCKVVEVSVATDVAIYILNYKRRPLSLIEERYAVKIVMKADNSLAGEQWRITKVKIDQDLEEDNEKNNEKNIDNNVVDMPKKKGRKTRKNTVEEEAKKEREVSGVEKQANVSSIFSGLWAKIID